MATIEGRSLFGDDNEPTEQMHGQPARRRRLDRRDLGRSSIPQWGKSALWVMLLVPAALIWLAFVYHLLRELFL